jgi:integrase/recombinase XerC
VRRLAGSPECTDAGGLERIEPLALRIYLAGFHGRHRPSTRNRRLAALRTFFRFQVRGGARATDPTEGLPGPKAERRLPAPLDASDCERLIETPPERRAPALVARDRALLDLLYGTGVRVGEVVRLNVRDFDPARRVLRAKRSRP